MKGIKKISNLYFYIAALPFCLIPMIAIADTIIDEVDDLNEDRIVITSSASTMKLSTPLVETPRAIAEISQQQIEERGAKKLDETMRYSSGVFATPYGPDNKNDWLIISEFDWSPYTNGLQTLKDNGYYHWQTELYGVEQLEMLKGPSSMLYGQNPPGGMINKALKKPQYQSQYQIDLNYGSNDYREIGIDSTGAITEDGRVLYRMVTMAKGSNGPTTGAENERYYLAPSLTFNFSPETTLTVMASYMKDNTNPTSGFKLAYGTLQGTPYGKVDYKTSFGEPGFGKNNSQQTSLGYEFRHTLNDKWTFHQNMSYNYLDLFFRNAYALSMIDDRHVNRGATLRDGVAQNWAVDNRMVGNWFFDNSENTLLIGADYFTAKTRGQSALVYSFGNPLDIFNPQYSHYSPIADSDIFNSNTSRYQQGIYLQNQFKYISNWLFLVSGRFDHATSTSEYADSRTDMRDNKFTKNAGIMYIADNGLHPYISYAESFEPQVGYDANGKAYIPVTGKQVEAGLKYSPDWLDGYINTAIYQLDQTNSFTTDPITSTQIQAGENRSRGIEVELSSQLTESWKMQASYTYNPAKTHRSLVAEEVNKRLAKNPKNNASLWSSYDLKGITEGLTVGVGVRYIGSSYGDKLNSADFKVPDYTLFDVMASYAINKNLKVRLNISNITNKRYVAACDYWCYYGDSRTINANLSYRW